MRAFVAGTFSFLAEPSDPFAGPRREMLVDRYQHFPDCAEMLSPGVPPEGGTRHIAQGSSECIAQMTP